jgi:hypothetical protein
MKPVAFVLFMSSTVLLFSETRLGKPLTQPEPLPVSKLLASPDSFLGKTVQVKGKATEVCEMMGCWINIAGERNQSVRVKVNDGDIVFPRAAIGKTVVAEGTFTKLELTREQAVARARHEAEEQGRKFNSAAVKAGVTIYQIQGSGAVVLE